MALLKPVTNQLQDKHGRAGDWVRRAAGEKDSSLSLHMLSAALVKGGVVLLRVHVEMGGCLTPFLFLRPWGNHTMFVLGFFFVPHDLQIFFSFFLNIFPPLSPSSRHVSGILARQERQNSCGCTEQFPINQGIMQAGNSNKMQMSGGARLQTKYLSPQQKKKKKPDRSRQSTA